MSDPIFDIGRDLKRAYDEGYEKGKADAEQRWIPVSERLPELNIKNLVSEDVLVFDGFDIRVGEYRKTRHLDREYWRIYGSDFDEFVNVIAWMPLPESYKAESECEE